MTQLCSWVVGAGRLGQVASLFVLSRAAVVGVSGDRGAMRGTHAPATALHRSLPACALTASLLSPLHVGTGLWLRLVFLFPLLCGLFVKEPEVV